MRNWKPYLRGITVLNLLYCFLTIGLLFLYDHDLTIFGWTYFIVEILVLVVLITIEFKASSKNA